MNYEYSFCVIRNDSSIDLTADFDITPLVRGRYNTIPEDCFPDEGGSAELIEPIYSDPEKTTEWDGELTNEELDEIQIAAYNSFDHHMSTRDPDDYEDEDIDANFVNIAELEFMD